MDYLALAIEIAVGAAGANLVALLSPGRSLGPRLNSIVGAIGSIATGSLLGGVFGGGRTGIALAGLTGAATLSFVLLRLRRRATPTPNDVTPVG